MSATGYLKNMLFLFSSSTGSSLCVRILDLTVPPSVELGQEDVELRCDYDYEEREKRQLEVKWYFADEQTPFFQWLPGEGRTPQIIGERNIYVFCFFLAHVVKTCKNM